MNILVGWDATMSYVVLLPSFWGKICRVKMVTSDKQLRDLFRCDVLPNNSFAVKQFVLTETKWWHLLPSSLLKVECILFATMTAHVYVDLPPKSQVLTQVKLCCSIFWRQRALVSLAVGSIFLQQVSSLSSDHSASYMDYCRGELIKYPIGEFQCSFEQKLGTWSSPWK